MCNHKLRDVFLSQNVMHNGHSKRRSWEGHVARTRKVERFAVFWWGNLRERDHLGNPGIDGMIILRRIFRKCDVVVRLDRPGSGQGQAAGTCE
jgi:hypothetical protein